MRIKPDSMEGGYIECALFTSGDDVGAYCFDDLSDETLAALCRDVRAFEAAYGTLLDEARRVGCSHAQLGHDLWLTRNWHGAGFWDRGLGALGAELTEAAHAEGERDLYQGDDGRVYLYPPA